MLLDLNPMFIPLFLIMIVAPIGAFDMIYFHIYKFKLYERDESRCETIVHMIRGMLFSVGAFILLNFKPDGIWFWVTGSIFLADFINSLVDVSIENQSRRAFGGLPTLEYVIHTVGSTFAGAIAAAFFILGWENQFLSSQLVAIPPGTYSAMFLLNGQFVILGGFLLVLFEIFLLSKSLCRRKC